MKLFLQINLSDWKTQSYNSPWLEQVKKSSQEIIVADVDPDSEATYVNHLNKLIEQADEIFALVNVEKETKLGIAMPLLYSLLRLQHKVKCVCMTGSHSYAEKILNTMRDKYFPNLPDKKITRLIDGFCKG